MAVQKTFVFTAVSYIKNKSDGSSLRCREEIVFRQEPDTCRFIPINIKKHMSDTEQVKCDKQMMQNAGKTMSQLK